MVIFPYSRSTLLLAWLKVRDAVLCQSIQHSEIDLPQPFVLDQIGGVAKLTDDELGRLHRSRERGGINLIKAKLFFESVSSEDGLVPPILGDRYVDVSQFSSVKEVALFRSNLFPDISLRLGMANYD